MSELDVYVVDTETCGLDPVVHDVIELSVLRLKTKEQRTWNIKPINPDNIEPKALQVNGVDINDLLWKTAAGKAKYRLADEVLPEIENWLADQGSPIESRVMVGHNVNFDFEMLKNLWYKCNAFDSFPFPKYGNIICTKQMALVYDYLLGSRSKYYNLSACVKKFGCEQLKAHGAINDVIMCAELFEKLGKEFAKGIER